MNGYSPSTAVLCGGFVAVWFAAVGSLLVARWAQRIFTRSYR